MSRQLWVVKLLPRPPLPSRPPRKRGGSTKTARPQLPQLLPRLIPQTRYQSAHQTHLCFCLEANLISLHSLLSSLSQVAIRQNVTHLLESFSDFPPMHCGQKQYSFAGCKKTQKMIPEVVFHIVIGHLWQWWEVSHYTKSLIIPRTEIVR